MRTALILLAAGNSSRMRGADKLLEDVRGLPCLRALALRGLAAGMQVIVPLPSSNHPRAAALAEVPVLPLPVADARDGMAHSLRAGIAAVPEATEAAIVLPGDMPAIQRDDLVALQKAAETHPEAVICQATTENGEEGHPILFRRALFDRFADLSGDRGAKEIVDAHKDRRVLVTRPGNRARLDLDTPEDWEAWRSTL